MPYIREVERKLENGDDPRESEAGLIFVKYVIGMIESGEYLFQKMEVEGSGSVGGKHYFRAVLTTPHMGVDINGEITEYKP